MARGVNRLYHRGTLDMTLEESDVPTDLLMYVNIATQYGYLDSIKNTVVIIYILTSEALWEEVTSKDRVRVKV